MYNELDSKVNKHDNDETSSTNSVENKSCSQGVRKTRTVPPFIAAHDVSRGAIHALQALLGYILMLAAM